MKRANQERSTDSKRLKKPVSAYAVQCAACFKWTQIPTKEEFETIRHSFTEEPWLCEKKPGRSCEDPSDLEYDTSRLWIIDRPNLPKPPAGFEREFSRRRNSYKFDALYVTPTGKKVYCKSDLEKFIEENPKYKYLDITDFSFIVPKIPKDMMSIADEGKGSASSKKKL